MNEFQKAILKFLKIEEKDLSQYLKNVSKEDIENPYNYRNMEEAKNRILQSIENKEKVMVYGDYDCDGITAVSIINRMYQLLNHKIGFYIPSRYLDGYGLNMEKAELIVKKKYQLVITVDNGVSCIEPIKYLKDHNVDVILTDHHEIINELPNADIIVHPSMKNNELLPVCGAYISFMISIAVLNRIDDYCLTLASLATVSDMMPLKSYNRDLLKLGLKNLNLHKEYPILKLLDKPNIINETTLGYDICPKINALGRLKEDLSVNDAVYFLLASDTFVADKYAKEILQTNNLRKNILKNVSDNLDLSIYKNDKVVCYRNDDLSEGIIGLVCTRIINQLEKPAIVFAKSKEGLIKASLRSYESFSIAKIYKELSIYLDHYGGHDCAGGLSLTEENYHPFIKALNEYASDKEIIAPTKEHIEIIEDDVNMENLQFINSLSPYGMEYPSPLLKLRIPTDKIIRIGKDKNSIRGNLKYGSFIGFSLYEKCIGKEYINVTGHLELNTFNNTAQFIIENLED